MKRNAQHRMSSLMQRYSPEEYEEVIKEETPSETEPDVNVDTTIAELQETQPEETAEDTIEGTQEVDPLPEENATDLINDGGDTGETVDLVPEENGDGSEEESGEDGDDDDFESGEILDAEADADVAEADKVEDEINDIDDTREALEAYAELIKSAGLDGISQQAAAFMSVGLKRAVKHAPSLESMYVSCEAFETGPRGAVTKANVSQESFGEAIKETFRKFIEWLKKRITAGRHFFNRFKNNIIELSSELKKFEAEVAQYKGRPMDEWETSVTPILFTGDKFTGYDLDQLIEPSKVVVKDLPDHLISIIKDITNKVSKIDVNKTTGDEITSVFESIISSVGEIKQSDITLPGGRTIKFNDGQEFGLKLEEDESFTASESKISTTRYPMEIKKAAKDARRCLDILLAANTKNDQLSSAYEAMITALEKLVKDADKSDDETTRGVAGNLRTSIAQLNKMLNPNNDKVVAYIAKCVTARLSFLSKAIKVGNGKEEERNKK